MAVSSAFTFSYEVEVSLGDGGALQATARSLQEAARELPGLAGAHPVVCIDADAIRFDACELPAKLGPALEIMASLIPPLRNWLIDRRLRRASVRCIEVPVPGLRALLEGGQVIRATLELDASGVPIDPPRATVALLLGDEVVRTWEGASVALFRN